MPIYGKRKTAEHHSQNKDDLHDNLARQSVTSRRMLSPTQPSTPETAAHDSGIAGTFHENSEKNKLTQQCFRKLKVETKLHTGTYAPQNITPTPESELVSSMRTKRRKSVSEDPDTTKPMYSRTRRSSLPVISPTSLVSQNPVDAGHPVKTSDSGSLVSAPLVNISSCSDSEKQCGIPRRKRSISMSSTLDAENSDTSQNSYARPSLTDSASEFDSVVSSTTLEPTEQHINEEKRFVQNSSRVLNLASNQAVVIPTEEGSSPRFTECVTLQDSKCTAISSSATAHQSVACHEIINPEIIDLTHEDSPTPNHGSVDQRISDMPHWTSSAGQTTHKSVDLTKDSNQQPSFQVYGVRHLTNKQQTANITHTKRRASVASCSPISPSCLKPTGKHPTGLDNSKSKVTIQSESTEERLSNGMVHPNLTQHPSRHSISNTDDLKSLNTSDCMNNSALIQEWCRNDNHSLRRQTQDASPYCKCNITNQVPEVGAVVDIQNINSHDEANNISDLLSKYLDEPKDEEAILVIDSSDEDDDVFDSLENANIANAPARLPSNEASRGSVGISEISNHDISLMSTAAPKNVSSASERPAYLSEADSNLEQIILLELLNDTTSGELNVLRSETYNTINDSTTYPCVSSMGTSQKDAHNDLDNNGIGDKVTIPEDLAKTNDSTYESFDNLRLLDNKSSFEGVSSPTSSVEILNPEVVSEFVPVSLSLEVTGRGNNEEGNHGISNTPVIVIDDGITQHGNNKDRKDRRPSSPEKADSSLVQILHSEFLNDTTACDLDVPTSAPDNTNDSTKYPCISSMGTFQKDTKNDLDNYGIGNKITSPEDLAKANDHTYESVGNPRTIDYKSCFEGMSSVSSSVDVRDGLNPGVISEFVPVSLSSKVTGKGHNHGNDHDGSKIPVSVIDVGISQHGNNTDGKDKRSFLPEKALSEACNEECAVVITEEMKAHIGSPSSRKTYRNANNHYSNIPVAIVEADSSPAILDCPSPQILSPPTPSTSSFSSPGPADTPDFDAFDLIDGMEDLLNIIGHTDPVEDPDELYATLGNAVENDQAVPPIPSMVESANPYDSGISSASVSMIHYS